MNSPDDQTDDAPENLFADIDDILAGWAEASGAERLGDVGTRGWPERHYLVAGRPPHEYFVVAVARPAPDRVTVEAKAVSPDAIVETVEGWSGPPADLDALLASGMATIGQWRHRIARQHRRDMIGRAAYTGALATLLFVGAFVPGSAIGNFLIGMAMVVAIPLAFVRRGRISLRGSP